MAHWYVLFLEGPLPGSAWTRPFHDRVGKEQPEGVAAGAFQDGGERIRLETHAKPLSRCFDGPLGGLGVQRADPGKREQPFREGLGGRRACDKLGSPAPTRVTGS